MVQPYGYASPQQQHAQGYYTSPPPQPYRASAGQARVPVQVPAFNPYQPQAQRPPPHAAPAQAAQPPLQQKGTLRPGQSINVGKEHVVVQRYLSEGGYAHVYLTSSTYPIGPDRLTQHCLKRIAFTDKEMLKDVKREIDTMKSLRGNKYITQYLDSSHNVLPNGIHEVFILMEVCSGGGIIDLLNKRLRDRLNENEILNIFTDVCEAVAFMHSRPQPLLHRDLKIENILSTPMPPGSPNPLIFKLCDFGSTTLPASHPPRSKAEADALAYDLNRHTTLQYRSPEMVEPMLGLAVGLPADVWALGVLLYKLCYYTTPFEEHGTLAIVNAKYTFPSFPVYSPQLQHLIASMLMEQPLRRPTVFEVLHIAHRMAGTRSEASYEIPSRSFPTSPKATKSTNHQNLLDFTSPAPALQAAAVPTSSPVDTVTPGRRGRPTPTKVANAPMAQQAAPSPPGERLPAAKPISKASVDEAFGIPQAAKSKSASSIGGFSDAFGTSSSPVGAPAGPQGFGDAFGASFSPPNQAPIAAKRYHGMSTVKPFSPSSTSTSATSPPAHTASTSSSSTQRSFAGFSDSFTSPSSSTVSPAAPDGNTSFESRFPSIEVLSSSEDGLTPTTTATSTKPPLRTYPSSSSADGLVSPIKPTATTSRPQYISKPSMGNLTGEHNAGVHNPAMQSSSKGLPLPRSTQVTGTAFKSSSQIIRSPSPLANAGEYFDGLTDEARPPAQTTDSSMSLLPHAAAPARDLLTGDNHRHDSLGPSMQPTLPDGSMPKMSRSLSSLSNRSQHLVSSPPVASVDPVSSDDDHEGPEDPTAAGRSTYNRKAATSPRMPSSQMATRLSGYDGTSPLQPTAVRRVSDRGRPQSMFVQNSLMPPPSSDLSASSSEVEQSTGPATMPGPMPRRNSINDIVSRFESMSSAPASGSLAEQQQRRPKPTVAAKPGGYRERDSTGALATLSSAPAPKPKPVVPIKAKTLQLAPSEYERPTDSSASVDRTTSMSSAKSAPDRMPPPKASKPRPRAQIFSSPDRLPVELPNSGSSSPERQQPVNMLIQRWNQVGSSAKANGDVKGRR